MEDGKPLVEFPRIWILALSKADLLPDLDVFEFRDLVIDKASDDLDELRKVLAGLVESPDALSVGEDFVLLSSAKFEPNRIEVTERIGLDLVLPWPPCFHSSDTSSGPRRSRLPGRWSRSCWAAPELWLPR